MSQRVLVWQFAVTLMVSSLNFASGDTIRVPLGELSGTHDANSGMIVLDFDLGAHFDQISQVALELEMDEFGRGGCTASIPMSCSELTSMSVLVTDLHTPISIEHFSNMSMKQVIVTASPAIKLRPLNGSPLYSLLEDGRGRIALQFDGATAVVASGGLAVTGTVAVPEPEAIGLLPAFLLVLGIRRRSQAAADGLRDQ